MEYYSVIQKNEYMSVVGKWIEPVIIMLSEITHSQKDKCHVFSLTHVI
jgi:hypothetical protein